MTEGWVPNNEELTQCVLLIQALRDPTRSDHKMALTALNQSRGNPSTVLHILHVFARGGAYESMGLSPDLRQLAGLVIKNYTFSQLPRLPATVQQMLKQEMLHALSDTQADIRNTAGILIGKISESFQIDTWADLLPPLYLMLDYKQHGSIPVVDGALQAIRRMCEDSVEKLSMDNVRKPLDVIIPKLIALFTCPDEMARLRALETINSTLFLLASSAGLRNKSVSPCNSEANLLSRAGHNKLSPSAGTRKGAEGDTNAMGGLNGHVNGHASVSSTQALVSNMNAFLQGLSTLATDPSAKVRKAVCQAIILIATVQLSVLEPMFGSICTFMLAGVLDEDEGVAMEACEFWSALSDDNDAHVVLQSHLSTLIPALISRLQLKEEQILQERIEEDAHASGEKEINFKPIHRRGRKDNQEQEEEEEMVSAKWTLRKQAALVLDNLAVTFSAALVLPHALSAIQIKLQAGGIGAEEVWVRESGMLALGALSTGCLAEMGQYLPQLFPFLIQNLSDPTPEMRSIACWVLSRYCSWIFEDEQVQMDGASDRYFVQLLEALLGIMLDPRPKVQTACCSALCTLVEVAGPDPVTPYLPQLMTYVQQAFSLYGVKSTLILVDTIGTIADVVGDALADRSLVALYFPKLMEKFVELEDDDMRLFPILECLTSVVAASGIECQPYAHGLYFRCLRIIGNTMAANAIADAKAAAVALKNGEANGLNSSTSSGSTDGLPVEGDESANDDDVPAKDFAICALDVLSGLCEGLESNFVILAESTRDTLLKLMLTCLQDGFPELRQSAFALTGDLSKNCVQFISPIAPQVLDIILRNLDFDLPMVCNNASWTVGELAIKVGGGAMAPYISRLMHFFIQILHEKDIPTTLTENVAITVGRLGVTNTAHLADYLSEYLEVWCMALRLTRQSHEKDHAFAGLIALINANPSVLFSPSSVTVPNAFFVACSSWDDPPDEPLLSELSRILRTYKSTNENGWRAMMTVMDRDRANKVIDMFRISA